MRISILYTLALLAVTWSGATAAAQTIRYQIGSNPPVSITFAPQDTERDITINVGLVNEQTLLRIWDPELVEGLPDDDVGKVTIVGEWATPGDLQVLIAGESSPWPSSFQSFITTRGVRNLGLAGSDGIEIVSSTSDLRDHTRLAGYVAEHLRGDIHVGYVNRLQVGPAGGPDLIMLRSVPCPGLRPAAAGSGSSGLAFAHARTAAKTRRVRGTAGAGHLSTFRGRNVTGTGCSGHLPTPPRPIA